MLILLTSQIKGKKGKLLTLIVITEINLRDLADGNEPRKIRSHFAAPDVTALRLKALRI